MKILDQTRIKQKIKRIAIEILERNSEAKEIVFAGINNKGYAFAEHICHEINKTADTKIILTRIKLNPADPLAHEVKLDISSQQLQKKSIVVVDDVANTGRTLFYAMDPILKSLPKKVEVAVLVDRMHKSFPIQVDYVGLTLATTMQENIEVDMSGKDWSVELN